MGRYSGNSTARNRHRSTGGQALSITAAAFTVIGFVALLITAFSVNVHAAVTNSNKIQLIADELAKVADDRNFWLGARRPQFQSGANARQQTEQILTDYSHALVERFDLPGGTAVAVAAVEEVQSDDGSVTFTKVTVNASGLRVPFDISNIFPESTKATAIGVATASSEPPPAFIRFGFKLINPSASNPSVTEATQVVILPAYGFQTDAPSASGGGNLGGTDNNGDVVGNQPDPRQCLWAGINHSPKPLASDAPFITGPDGRQIKAFN